jgi:tRNA threonylcarbamoyladenosine biosynthesis protein TsaB
MHILALETTAVTGSVAASDGTNLLLELDLAPQQRSAQSLAPAILQLLCRVAWKPLDVELVAVTIGPGSFTGLRVGVTTAKTFAYAVGAAILGIDTLETIAAGMPANSPLPDHCVVPGEGLGEGGSRKGEKRASRFERAGPSSAPMAEGAFSSLHVAMDAQRGDLITQTFLLAPDGWFHPEGDQKLLPADQWFKELAPGGMIAGPVLGKLQTLIPPYLTVLPEPLWHPRARHVARLAARDYAAGRRDDLWRLVPRYSRRSAAEEKRETAQSQPSQT